MHSLHKNKYKEGIRWMAVNEIVIVTSCKIVFSFLDALRIEHEK